MKISKEKQKEFMQQIRLIAKNKGMKLISNSLYVIKGDNFIHTDFLIVESTKLIYRLYVKKYSYDDIFWNAVKFNLKEMKLSLRANGAFSAPSVFIKKGEYDLSEEVASLANLLIKDIEIASAEFIEHHDVNKYVLEEYNGQDINILKCLAYMDINDIAKAADVAKKALDSGDRGRFIIGGKGFFEYLLLDIDN